MSQQFLGCKRNELFYSSHMDLSNERKSYEKGTLRRAKLAEDPIQMFERWYEEAEAEDRITEANAMVLATVGADGQPLQRTVLLKEFDAKGFVYYSNYRSRKANDISENDQVCLLFPWIDMERQVIVRGTVEKVSRQQTSDYFKTRPRESQLGAWVSEQSSVVESRDVLLRELERLKKKFDGEEIPAPDFWGGYRVKPKTIEFWQGGPGRVHDRFEFRKDGSVVRLSP